MDLKSIGTSDFIKMQSAGNNGVDEFMLGGKVYGIFLIVTNLVPFFMAIAELLDSQVLTY